MPFSKKHIEVNRTSTDAELTSEIVETFTDPQTGDNYYSKFPRIDDEDILEHRVLNEWIATVISTQANKALIRKFKLFDAYPIVIPYCELILSDENYDQNTRVSGVATREIEYRPIEDSPSLSESKISRTLHDVIDLHIGIAHAFRFFLDDPDGKANIGFTTKFKKTCLGILDFGLADYFYLRENHLLTKNESRRLTGDIESSLLTTGDLSTLLLSVFPKFTDQFNDETSLHLFPYLMFNYSPWDDISDLQIINLAKDYYTCLFVMATEICDIDLFRLITATYDERETKHLKVLFENNSHIKSLCEKILLRYQEKAQRLASILTENLSIEKLTSALQHTDGLGERLKNNDIAPFLLAAFKEIHQTLQYGKSQNHPDQKLSVLSKSKLYRACHADENNVLTENNHPAGKIENILTKTT